MLFYKIKTENNIFGRNIKYNKNIKIIIREQK